MLLLLGFLSCVACNKDARYQRTGLVGSWNWVLQYNNGISSGSFSGNPTGDSLTPASTGIRETLQFFADGQWTDTRNGVIFGMGTYKIDTIFTPAWPVAALDLVRADGTDSFVNHVIRGDTLTISDMKVVTVDFNRVYVKQ